METKQKLINAALQVFSQKGYAASTTKDIAREAGVTDGLIYHYFSSKEELLLAVVDQYTLNHGLSDWVTSLKGGGAADMKNMLLLFYRYMMDMLHANEPLIVMFFGESHLNPVIHEKLGEIITRGVEILCQLIKEQATVEEAELRTAIRNTNMAVTMYFLTHDRFHKDREASTVYLKHTVTHLLRSICAK